MFRKFKTFKSRPKIRQVDPSINLKHKRLVSGFLIVTLLLLSIIFLLLKVLVIRTVKISNETSTCITDQEAKDNLHILGIGIFFFDKQKTKNSLLNKYPCIAKVNLSIHFPQTVVANLYPRKGAMIIQAVSQPDDFEKATRLLKIWESTGSGKQLDATATASLIPTLDISFADATISGTFIVDDTGMIFSKNVAADNLPVVEAFIENIGVGHRIDERIVKNIKTILGRLKGLEIKVSNEKLVKETYLILNVELPNQSASKSILVFLLDRDNQKELASLQLILQRNRIDLRSIGSVDLRFDKPIVTFSKKK